MYATPEDLVARFGLTEMVRLSRPEDRTAETVDPVRLETALTDATSLIDDYLRKLYRLPLGTVPASLVRAACVLSRYDLAQGTPADPTEEMRLARKEVIDWLKAIAAGVVELDAPGLGGAGQTSSGGARVSDRRRAFSDDELGGW